MRTLLLTIIISSFAYTVIAQNTHSTSGMKHTEHMMTAAVHDNNIPKEAGQGAFATLAEIIVFLENDSTTDWSTVDIDGLRQHLVDMNQLMLNAKVVKDVEEKRITFKVSGSGITLRAIQTMVPAHAMQLTDSTQWDVKAELTADGVTLIVASQDINEIQKVSGLGFFGVMATGGHHQEHHLQMARGKGHFH